MFATSLDGAGIPLDAVGDAIGRGELTLSFFDAAAYERFSAIADETFRQASERTGIPLELVMVDPRGDRDGAALARRPPPRGRAADPAVRRGADRRRLPSGGDRAAAPRPGRQHPPDHRAGGRLVVLRGDRAGDGRGQRRRGDERPRPLGPDHAARRHLAARHVPRAPGPRLDRQHHRRLRDDDGAGGDPQPPRAAPRDLLPRHQRLHEAHAGAWRRRGRRARCDGRAVGSPQLDRARRQADQVARRRRDVPLPRPEPGRARRPGDGGRARRPRACRRATWASRRARCCTRRATTSGRP